MSRRPFIQQDGAKNHIWEDDKEFNDTLTEQSIDTALYTQAVNSPDVNLLDLDFLRAIQSFNDTTPRNKEELKQAVSMAYDNYLQNKLNHTWLTLQCCFNQIILHNGDNDYNVEHISKEILECTGQLPDVLDVVEEAAQIFNVNDTDDETNNTNYESDEENNS